MESNSTGPVRLTRKLPGATVEPGESVAAAMTRGVREETGLTVIGIRHHVGDFDYLSPAGKPVRRLRFAVDMKATEPIHLSAHAGYLWATLDRDLLVTPSIREILGAYKNLVCT